MSYYVYIAMTVGLVFVGVYCLARVAANGYFAEKMVYMKRVAKELH